LANPVCGLAFPYIAWMFFYQRLLLEEACLVRFFGPAYHTWAMQRGTGIPFLDAAVAPSRANAAEGLMHTSDSSGPAESDLTSFMKNFQNEQ